MKLFAIASVFALSSILVSGSAIGSAINMDKRQDICTNSTCTVACDTTPGTPTDTADCDGLIAYIASYAPGEITLGAGQNQTWTNGTCEIVVTNYDSMDYTICYETIATDADNAETTCFEMTMSATCSGSGESGDNYAVQISSG